MGEKQTRRQFTREFKVEAVRLVAVGDRPLTQVARELGVRPDMLRQWKRQAEGRSDAPRRDGAPGRLTSQDEEIRRLRRELAQVREERDILGKATAFFAKGLR
jgi:transposase